MTRLSIRSLFTVIAITGLLALASPAHAGNYWSQTGAQCVVDDNAHANALYSRTSGGIKFAAGKTGTIGLFCSISKNTGETPGPNRLRVTYQDTDLSGNSATLVMARLFHAPRFSTSIWLGQIGTDITSASPQLGASADNWMERVISHTFDFENYHYFVYLELKRTSPSQQAILYGVALDYIPG